MSLWLKFRGRLVYTELKDEDYCPSLSWFDFHVLMLPNCGTQGTMKLKKKACGLKDLQRKNGNR